VVVQHLPAGFTGPLAERLDAICRIRVREAQTGDRPEPGVALIAPGDQHLEFTPDGHVMLTQAPEVNGVRPSADVTLPSAATVFGRRCVAVVMTGMGRDGAEGVRQVKAHGGAVLVQDQQSAVIWGMPRAAVETGCVDLVVPLGDLADAIRRA
jgi:two-component system chemotaxis response regulator CheB